jgi:hypothetical protein
METDNLEEFSVDGISIQNGLGVMGLEKMNRV